VATNESQKIGVFSRKFFLLRYRSEMDWNIQMAMGSLEAA